MELPAWGKLSAGLDDRLSWRLPLPDVQLLGGAFLPVIAPVDDLSRPHDSEDHVGSSGTGEANTGSRPRLRWFRRTVTSASSTAPGEKAGPDHAGTTEGAAPPAPAAAAPPAPDDLPDDSIPLTPELVEEDAQRNDFVLRLTVVLLALLLGLTEIGETETLVHIRTGQYQAANGFLPPRTDVFSYTAADRPWVNLSWLFDLAVAGVYGLGGGIGLTVFKAILAAVTFWYVAHTNRTGASTWWGSVCAALALLVCFTQLTALPEIITLLGVAVVLWLLNRWEQGGPARSLWLLVPLIAIWSNLDSRVFVGVLLVVLYAVGGLVDHLLGRSGERDASRVRTLGLAAAATVVAALLNPFLWESLLAPLSLYSDVYPAWRTYHQFVSSVKQLEAYGLIEPTYWQAFAASGIVRLMAIAGLSLAAAALVAMGLNWRRLRVAHVAVFLASVVLAMAGSHELAAASIVWCVLANLNAQDWYRATFRQTYSTNFSERLFSTGGRFVSVIGLLVIAWLGVSGELSGREGNRIGVGFRQPLQAETVGLTGDLESVPQDHRLFNTEPEQGDLMIWVGRPPFIDSRLALYAGAGDEDLLSQHIQTRNALRPYVASIPHSGDRKVWQDAFQAHDVDGVLVHLAGRYPRYELYWELRALDQFRLSELGAAGAVMEWTGSPDVAAGDDSAGSSIDLLQAAFRPEAPPEIPTRYDSAQPRSLYDRLFNLPKARRSVPFQKARHYDMHVRVYAEAAATGGLAPGEIATAAALAHLAIRHAHLELADNPQFAECYRILGHSYEFLEGLERQVNVLGGGSEWTQRRYLQAVNAYRQAVIVDPEDVDTWQRLRNLFLRHGKLDLVLEAQKHVDANLPDLSRLSAAEQRQIAQERRQIRELVSQVRGTVNAIEAQIERALAESESPEAALRLAYQQNCILRALELIESVDEEQRFRDPAIRMFEAMLRLEAGHARQASEILAELEETRGSSQMPQWRGFAALASVARGDFVHAVGLWNEEARDLEELRFEMVFGTLPLAVPPPEYFRTDLPFAGWPVDHTMALQGAHYTVPAQRSVALFNAALTYLEIGQAEEASERFAQLLEGDPDTTLRPLVRLYYLHASGSDEPIDIYPRSDRIPLSAEVFATGQSGSPEAVEAPRPAPPVQPDVESGNPR